jgi:glycyl-tRNA synthetase
METIVELCKRRGLIFQSSEIYGGLRGAWDYGPLGAALKDNVKNAWKRAMIQLRDDVVQLDASILMHPRVWEASGHVEGFTDPLVECTSCNQRFRADQMATNAKGEVVLPELRRQGLHRAEAVQPHVPHLRRAVEDSSAQVWMRPRPPRRCSSTSPTCS